MNTSSLTLALLICVAGPAGAQDLVTSLDLRTGNQTARASDPSVDDFYGEFKERLEIPVPAYRGLEPKVALRYRSSGGNGVAGVGFALDPVSQIDRVSPGRGAPTFSTSDVYTLDGEELIPCTSGSASPSCKAGGTHSLRIDDFRRIRFTGTIWEITEREGPCAATGRPTAPCPRSRACRRAGC